MSVFVWYTQISDPRSIALPIATTGLLVGPIPELPLIRSLSSYLAQPLMTALTEHLTGGLCDRWPADP